MKWAAQQRQIFIKEFLDEYSCINRSDIIAKFSIGPAQATRDLQIYIKNNAEALVYNVTDKCYEKAETN